jgi:hypothetical protein
LAAGKDRFEDEKRRQVAAGGGWGVKCHAQVWGAGRFANEYTAFSRLRRL